MRVLNCFTLVVEIREGACTDRLRLVGEGLAGFQALRAPVQAVCPGKQLLALL